MPVKIIPVGTVFGRLTVTGVGDKFLNSQNSYQSTSACICECGENKTVTNNRLRNGSTSSCGCLRRVVNGTKIQSEHRREYGVWMAMKKRTTIPTTKGYADYGGRGIKVCERWFNSFENFVDDMGPRPSQEHSIDRIDNNGNYEPTNCRWATKLEQSNNRRDNVMITLYGKTMSASRWAVIAQIGPNTLIKRIRMGWDVKNAVWTPPRKKNTVRD